jgi:hypothetical protein
MKMVLPVMFIRAYLSCSRPSLPHVA